MEPDWLKFLKWGYEALKFAGTSQKNRKINTKTLCDIIGSRYYEHNEEINMSEDKMVRCFDENDTVIGDLTLREAL